MADKPVTREEKYLAYLTGDYKGEIPKPITRKEKYLYELCLKGIGGEISPEEIKNAVNEYLEKNPVKPGTTTEQAQQIEQNKADVASLKEETGSLKEDLKKIGDTTHRIDINVYDKSVAKAPYDDLNTLPANKTVMYSHITGIKNYPSSASSICHTISHKSTGFTPISYGAQILIDYNSSFYIRICENYKWSSWTPIEKGVRNIYDSTQISTPFDNADTFPGNSHVYCSYTGVKNIPDKTPGLCITHTFGATAENGSLQFYSGTNGIVYIRTKKADGWTSWASINQKNDNTHEQLYASFTQFPKIGVIGDSYASGEIYINESGHDYYQLSWLQCIARTCGITGTNFSSGGLSTRSWLTASRGLPLVNSSDAQNLYIFALGINDCYALGESYLGTPDDIKEDYNTNPDTFYGNYAKIIEQVKIKAPNAKLLMLTTASTNTVPMKFNNAIEYIANHYGIPFARQYEYEFFKSTYYKNKVGGHPTAVMYSGMAEAFKQIFSDVCIKYQAYFNDYVG